MADNFASQDQILSGVVSSISPTLSDTVNLPNISRGIHCNVSGNVSVLHKNDTVSVTKAVNAGVTYPWRVQRVNLTGTTATVLVEY